MSDAPSSLRSSIDAGKVAGHPGRRVQSVCARMRVTASLELAKITAEVDRLST